MSDDANAFDFSGPWVGQTMGHDSPAHVWEITFASFGETSRYAPISTCWEGETTRRTLSPKIVTIGDHTTLDFGNQRTAVPVGVHHFVIPKWDTNEIRNKKGRHLDVVFSRPGVAELSAHDAYRRYLELKAVSTKATKATKPRVRARQS